MEPFKVDAIGKLKTSKLSLRVGTPLTFNFGHKIGFAKMVRILDHAPALSEPLSKTAPDLAPQAWLSRCNPPRIESLRIGILGGYFHDHASPAAREVLAFAATMLGVTEEVISLQRRGAKTCACAWRARWKRPVW